MAAGSGCDTVAAAVVVAGVRRTVQAKPRQDGPRPDQAKPYMGLDLRDNRAGAGRYTIGWASGILGLELAGMCGLGLKDAGELAGIWGVGGKYYMES